MRADCVFGGARLISSARMMFEKTGPWANSNSRSCSLNTFEPVISAGNISGVNWIRLNSKPTVSAIVRAVSVLPVPGTSSTRTCCLERTPTSKLSRKGSEAMTAFDTSERISLHKDSARSVENGGSPVDSAMAVRSYQSGIMVVIGSQKSTKSRQAVLDTTPTVGSDRAQTQIMGFHLEDG